MSQNDNLMNTFIKVMNECGFDISEETLDDELQYDSLQFVSAMVTLEDVFNLQIPDQFLLAEGLDSGRDIYNMVLQLTN